MGASVFAMAKGTEDYKKESLRYRDFTWENRRVPFYRVIDDEWNIIR